MANEMTRREMFNFINAQRWVFAKTYAAYAPHEYIVRNNVADKEEFDRAEKFIEKNGMRMFYYKHERKYLYCDGWFYWVMKDSENDPTAVLNRCKPEDYDIVFMQRGTQARAQAKADEVKRKTEQLKFL